MWTLEASNHLGFLATIGDVFTRAQHRGSVRFPDLRSYEVLIAASDYSGYHRTAVYRGLSFLVAGADSVFAWNEAHEEIRRRAKLGRRRLSFKTLKDRVRNSGFHHFVAAADAIDGVLVTFLVKNAVASLFQVGPLRGSGIVDHPLMHGYTAQSAERLLEATHLLALLLGKSSP